MDVLVSVVIPTHGRADYMVFAVESVISQTYTNWECFVVSDDPHEFNQKRELIEQFGDERVKFCEGYGSGANASRNLGVDMSNGDIIAFLDDDDLWVSNKLEMHVEMHQKKDFVYSNVYLRYEGKLNYDFYAKRTHPGGDILELMNQFKWGTRTSSCVSIKKRFMIENKWDERLKSFQDWDLWYRCVQSGSDVGYIDTPLCVWRQHGGLRVSKGYEKRCEALRLLQQKYGDKGLNIQIRLNREYRDMLEAKIAHVGIISFIISCIKRRKNEVSVLDMKLLLNVIFRFDPYSISMLRIRQLYWTLKGKCVEILWH